MCSSDLLGVFGLGGLGTDLKLTLQSLEFRELWTDLWLLLAVMLLLENGVAWLRRRWLMPPRLGLARAGVGLRGREMLLALVALPPLCGAIALLLGVDPRALLKVQPLQGGAGAGWGATATPCWRSPGPA